MALVTRTRRILLSDSTSVERINFAAAAAAVPRLTGPDGAGAVVNVSHCVGITTPKDGVARARETEEGGGERRERGGGVEKAQSASCRGAVISRKQ